MADGGKAMAVTMVIRVKESDIKASGGVLHRQVYRLLRREISSSFKAGDRLPSQNELAKRFGIGFPTVREALSILAEEGVIKRHRGRDTVVLDPNAGRHIAILAELDIAHPLCGYYFRQVFQSLRTELQERGCRARPYLGTAPPGQEDPDFYTHTETTATDLLADLESGRILAVVAPTGCSRRLVWRLNQLGVPLVGCGPELPYRVEADIPAVIRRGVDYLLEQGRRRIAFLSWGSPNEIIAHTRSRGLDINTNWLRYDLNPSRPGAGWEEFREVWGASPIKPDGLLVTDDVLFADALHALVEQHIKIPDDLLVVTHACAGGPFWAPFPVVRLEVDPVAVAADMAQLTLDLLADPNLPPCTRRIGYTLDDACLSAATGTTPSFADIRSEDATPLATVRN